jgi:hypothetical protein
MRKARNGRELSRGLFSMSTTAKDNVTCSTNASPTSGAELKDVLCQQGIALDTKQKNLIEHLVAEGESVLEALCFCKEDRKEGPFLMVVKVLLPQKDLYGALLTELTGDNTLSELFDSPEPVYIRILRCRPALKNILKQSLVKSLA